MTGQREPVGVVDRRALAVEVRALRVRADQPVEVARLELVRVARERRQVADAVVARAGAERVAEGERAERRVAAGAAARDGAALAVGQTPRDEVARAVHAVVDVHDAPRAVRAARGRRGRSRCCRRSSRRGRRSRGSSSTGCLRLERAGGRAGRPAVAHDDERRPLACGRAEVAVARRVVEGVRGQAVFGRKLDRPRPPRGSPRRSPDRSSG